MTYNMKCPAVKRLMKEAQELRESTDLYFAQPTEDNLFDWHFTIRGPTDSEFDGGIYHGRIILPSEYPMKPPSIIVLTENGRFETNKKICLSISSYHPESWRPSWSIRTAILAVIGFMPTSGAGAIGSLDYSKEERKRLAKASLLFNCECCGPIKDLLKPLKESSKAVISEAKDVASQMTFTDSSQESKPKANTEVKVEEKPNTVKIEEDPQSGLQLPQNTSGPMFYVCYPIYCRMNSTGNVQNLSAPFPVSNFALYQNNIQTPNEPKKPMSFEEFLAAKKKTPENPATKPSTSTVTETPKPSTSNDDKSAVEEKKVEEPASNIDEENEREVMLRHRKRAMQLLKKNAEHHRKQVERMQRNLNRPVNQALTSSQREAINNRLLITQICIGVVIILIFLMTVKRILTANI